MAASTLETDDGRPNSDGEMVLAVALHQPNVQIVSLITGARVDARSAATFLSSYARKLKDSAHLLYLEAQRTSCSDRH